MSSSIKKFVGEGGGEIPPRSDSPILILTPQRIIDPTKKHRYDGPPWPGDAGSFWDWARQNQADYEDSLPKAFCPRHEEIMSVRQDEKGFWFCESCGCLVSEGPKEEAQKSPLKEKIRKIIEGE